MIKSLKVVKNDKNLIFNECEHLEFENVQQITFVTAGELKRMGHDTGKYKGKDMFFTLDIVLPNGNCTFATFSCSDYFIISY